MSQTIELERTFLAKELPKETKTTKPTRIMDVYIPDTSKHAHLRLRQKGEKYEITKKMPISGSDSSEQTEQTIYLTKEEFIALAKCSKKRISKDRYNVIIEGNAAEVDIFVGDLEGLILIDFEFGSVEEKANFKMPEVALAEVTQEEFVAGGFLSGKTYNDISSDLKRFNYQKII